MMFVRILTLLSIAMLISSCQSVYDVQDNIKHYERLERDQNIKVINYSKNTNTIAGMRFLVANYPDDIIYLNGNDFDKRYKKFVSYLIDNHYTIVVNEKLSATATIIAQVPKPMPDIRYIAIIMEQDGHTQRTEYSITYGNSKFLANKLYNSYKASLVLKKDSVQ